VGRSFIVTRVDVEELYPGVDSFVPTHRVEVVDGRNPKQVLRRDLVRLENPGDEDVAYAYVPVEDEPVYGVLSTGLWQCFLTHGRVRARPVKFREVAPKEVRGAVYFVQAGIDGPIKIGWSQDVSRRISELQTANAMRLRLLGTVPGTLEDEAAMHARFARFRIEAEWFQNVPEIHEYLRSR